MDRKRELEKYKKIVLNNNQTTNDNKVKLFELAKDNNDLQTICVLADYLDFEIAQLFLEERDKEFEDFIQVIFYSNSKDIELLIKKGDINLDFQSGAGITALMIAVENNNIGVVKLLIDKGVDLNVLNSFDRSALMIAIGCGNIEIAILLIKEDSINLDFQDETGFRVLMTVILEENINNIELPSLLIKQGADLNIQDYEGETALMIAIGCENIEIAILLIKEDSLDINTILNPYRNILLFAIADGNEDINIIKLLIRHGNINLNYQNDNGETALMWLVFSFNNTALVELIIKEGADVSIQDNNGKTALMWLKESGYNNIEIIKLLKLR